MACIIKHQCSSCPYPCKRDTVDGIKRYQTYYRKEMTNRNLINEIPSVFLAN